MFNVQNANRIAVFIDVENLVFEVSKTDISLRLRPIIDRIREEGQIVSMRAYGDWSQPSISRHLNEFRVNIIEMTQLSTSVYGKNTADIQLAVDALEMALQSTSPDTVVIISGDRDFVPLVQKIKRYGKSVLGIGANEGSTSELLASACDMFLFVDDILNVDSSNQQPPIEDILPIKDLQPTEIIITPAPCEVPHSTVPEESVIPDTTNRKQRKAFLLLVKAISACERQMQPASESIVNMRMRQIKSTFYPNRFGFTTFRDFAIAAEKSGYVKIMPGDNTDGVVFDTSYHVAPQLLQEDPADFDYSTVESAVDSYRDILREYKKLELLCWSDRKKLVTRVWDYLTENSSHPQTYDEIIGDLQLYAASNMSGINARAVEIVVRTLSIAKCFDSDDGFPNFENTTCHIKPAVNLDEALRWMNYTYLNGIKMSVNDVVFVPDAVAILLFDEITDSSREETLKVFDMLGVSLETNETAMSLALKKAVAAKGITATESN